MSNRTPDDLLGKIVAFMVMNRGRFLRRGRTVNDRRPIGYRTGKVLRVDTKAGKLDSLLVSLIAPMYRPPYSGPRIRVYADELCANGACGIRWFGKIRPLDSWLAGGNSNGGSR